MSACARASDAATWVFLADATGDAAATGAGAPTHGGSAGVDALAAGAGSGSMMGAGTSADVGSDQTTSAGRRDRHSAHEKQATSVATDTAATTPRNTDRPSGNGARCAGAIGTSAPFQNLYRTPTVGLMLVVWR